jgi:PIN domain nuclease of toxin-antitoxin system
MIAGVADTHAAIWFLYGDRRLSQVAKDFFDKATGARQRIALLPISLAEVVYLVEKNRLPDSAFEDLQAALDNPYHVLQEAPLTVAVMNAMRQVSRAAIPDMPDRIVAATAVFLCVPLITRDGRILASTVLTIW